MRTRFSPQISELVAGFRDHRFDAAGLRDDRFDAAGPRDDRLDAAFTRRPFVPDVATQVLATEPVCAVLPALARPGRPPIQRSWRSEVEGQEAPRRPALRSQRYQVIR